MNAALFLPAAAIALAHLVYLLALAPEKGPVDFSSMWVALALLIVSSSLVAGMLLKDVRAISVMALVSAGGRRVVELLMVSNRAPGFLKLERDALPYWTWILAAELGVWFVVGWLGHQARVAIAARMAR